MDEEADVDSNDNRIKTRNLPIDRGWAYVVMLSLALWNIFMAGTMKSFGVFYIEFIDLFRERPSTTAWIGGTFGLTTTILAPVAGYIADRYEVKTTRIIVLICALIASFGMAITSLASNVWWALVSYGIIAGAAAGVMDSPILSMVGVYFRKKRSFASGVTFAGSSIGTVVLPPLIAICVTEYSARGALLIFGGLWLHTLIVGAIMRPIPKPSELENQPPKEPLEDQYNETKDSGQNDKIKDCCTDSHGKGSDIDKLKDLPPLSLQKENRSDTVEFIKCLKRVFRENLDFLSTPRLGMLCMTFIWASFAYFSQFFIIPSLVEELGLSRLFGSFMVALANAIEIVARQLTGYIAYRYPSKKNFLLYVNFISSSFCAILVSFYLTKHTIIIYSVVFGLFGGIFCPMIIPTLYDVVKPSEIGRASGLHPVLTGIGFSIGPPLLGVFRELSGSYIICLQVCGITYIVAAFFLRLSTWNRKLCLLTHCCNKTTNLNQTKYTSSE